MFSKKIEFITNPSLFGSIAEPKPAAKFVPSWYKNLEKDTGEFDIPGFSHKNGVTSTIKRCVPFLDTFTTGYIIPAPVDMHIKRDKDSDDGVSNISYYSCLTLDGEPLVKIDHSFAQLNNHEYSSNNNTIIMKFINPWTIRTPDGYSCLFVSPLNSNRLKNVEIISGIVDTDNYFSNINFPFFYHSKENESLLIEKGTPLVQVIPFKRDSWNIKVSSFSEKETNKKMSVDNSIRSIFYNGYRNLFWKRKIFK